MAKNFTETESGLLLEGQAIDNLSAGLTRQSLFEQHVMFATDKQADLQKAIGSSTWKLDLNLRQICFEPNLVFSVQLLGTFVHASKNWLWAWDNATAHWPQNVYQQAFQLKAYGQANGVEVFTQSNCEMSIETLNEIGIIASGIFSSNAYYIADDGQNAMLFTLSGPEFPKTTGLELDMRIRKTAVQTILAFEFNHAVAIEHYFKANGFTISKNGNRLIGINGGNGHIAEFDELDRLTSLG
jgi:hypothetical protein